MKENVNESSDKSWTWAIPQSPCVLGSIWNVPWRWRNPAQAFLRQSHYTWKLRLFNALLFTCIFLCQIFQKAFPLKIQKDKHVFEMDRWSLHHFRNLSPFHTRILTLKLRLSFLFTCEALCVLPALERTMSLLLLTAESGLGIDERKLELEIGVPCAWDLILLGWPRLILTCLKGR